MMETSDSVVFVDENIPGPKEDTDEYNLLIDNFNSQITEHCGCSDICMPFSCCCIKNSVESNYTLDQSTNKLVLNPNLIINSYLTRPIMECNDLCSCSISCGNRLVQKGPHDDLFVTKCTNENKGLGLFTNKLIRKGVFICEYAGEVITKTQALARHQYNLKNNRMNYIFCLNEHSDSTLTQTFVDPSYFGNIGRYANHSCDPNCVIIPVRVNTPIPKIAIFSCTDIKPGTEITFQYGYSGSKNQSDVNRTKCLCGSLKCQGWMPYEVYLDQGCPDQI